LTGERNRSFPDVTANWQGFTGISCYYLWRVVKVELGRGLIPFMQGESTMDNNIVLVSGSPRKNGNRLGEEI